MLAGVSVDTKHRRARDATRCERRPGPAQSAQQEDAAELGFFFPVKQSQRSCSRVSKEPAVRTHRWAGQVLTCPPAAAAAAAHYYVICSLVMLIEKSGITL